MRETSASEPLTTHRNELWTASKPGSPSCSGISVEDTCLLTTRCPVFRRRDSHLGSRMELETLAGHAKGKGTSGRPARPKVPMGQSGADRPIVAMKRGNARGAKGVGHSRRCWVNGRPEEPSFFAGRRRPSLSGTSRMRRESPVRICERLGVKFPGPTRRYSATSLGALLRQSPSGRRYAITCIVSHVAASAGFRTPSISTLTS